MKKTTSLLFLLMFAFSTSVFAKDTSDYQTIKTQEYNLKIDSPIDMILVSDFSITPESIKIRGVSDFSIVSGQSFIYRYDFLNKLDYTVVGRYELSFGKENLSSLKNIGVYISEALDDKTCISKNGEILKYSNNIIQVDDSKSISNLCTNTKDIDYFIIDDSLILDMVLEPGINTKYFLFTTTPTFSLVDSSFSFQESIKLKTTIDSDFFNNDSKDFGKVSVSNAQNESDSKELNSFLNQEKYTKANSNYNVKTKEINSNFQEAKPIVEQSFSNIKESTKNLKNKAVALVTMTPTKWGFIVVCVLAVVALAVYLNSKKDK